MNDKTILRIKVPAHLYESVKAQLTLDEAKQNFGTKDMKAVKATKKTAAPKANAPVRVTPDNEVKADKDVPGMGLTEKNNSSGDKPKKSAPKANAKNKVDSRKLSMDELKKMHEILGEKISKMESRYDRRRAGLTDDEPGEQAHDRYQSYFRKKKYNDKYSMPTPAQIARKRSDDELRRSQMPDEL